MKYDLTRTRAGQGGGSPAISWALFPRWRHSSRVSRLYARMINDRVWLHTSRQLFWLKWILAVIMLHLVFETVQCLVMRHVCDTFFVSLKMQISISWYYRSLFCLYRRLRWTGETEGSYGRRLRLRVLSKCAGQVHGERHMGWPAHSQEVSFHRAVYLWCLW